MVWQGMRTSTGHPGGITRRVGYLVTDGDKPDGDVPQQPEGLRCEARCGVPILQQWIKGKCGVGATRSAQQEGERGHVLPRDEYGEMRECAYGFIWVVSGRAGNSII